MGDTVRHVGSVLDVCHTGINVCTNESGWCYGSGFTPVSFSVSRFSVVKIFYCGNVYLCIPRLLDASPVRSATVYGCDGGAQWSGV